MSDKNILDRRQTKTREAILKAFTEILFEQNYQKIKISMVAPVSYTHLDVYKRQVFY